MQRRKRPVLIGSVLMGLALATAVHAGTPPGSPVTISGLDNLTATVDTQAKEGIGKGLAVIMGLAGFAMLAGGRPGLGAAGIGAGIGMAFVPNIIGTAFDATAAHALLPLTAGSAFAGHWWTPVLAVAYPVLLLFRVAIDPVVLWAVACSQALRFYRTRRTDAAH